MIRIDRITFDFVVPKEEFARELYTSWDEFCHKCFEQVVESTFVPYENEDEFYELEHIDLDLGNIPEDVFIEEYPRRLKLELQKIQLKLKKRKSASVGGNVSLRIERILSFLKYGVFEDVRFNISDEIGWLKNHSSSVADGCIRQIAALALDNCYSLYRLVWNVDDVSVLIDVFKAAIAMPEFTVTQRHRFLMSFLEVRSNVPVLFIRQFGIDSELHCMAGLLESRSVGIIMRTVVSSRSDSSLSSYWHYLYEWLIANYPYKSENLFGDKTQFSRHVHECLLVFINKHDGLSYLSENELIAGFVRAVFAGPQYARVVASILRMLRHDSQSVAHSGYFGQKLYMAFLRMSLHCCSASENAVSISDAAELVVFLKSGSVSRRDSQNFVVQLVKEQPRLLVECLCGDHESRELLLSYLMPSVKFGVTESLLSSISLSLAEATDDFRRKVWSHKDSVEWLVEISEEKFDVAFGKSVLRWIAAKKSGMDFSIGSLFRLLYCEVTEHGDYSKADALLKEKNIFEDVFIEEYPRRLKLELQKIQLKLKKRNSASVGGNVSLRIERILSFLKYGVFEDVRFNISDEIGWLKNHSSSVADGCIRQIAALALDNCYSLYRLVWNVDDVSVLIDVFKAAIAMPEFTVTQRHRFLMSFLEVRSNVPVLFIRQFGIDSELHCMAGLLESRSVGIIMRTVVSSRSDSSLSSYWHYLYEWLIANYPYKSENLFGDKTQFSRHVHECLLVFINKHDGLSYLSENELIAGFVRAVFAGPQYARVVASILRMLRHDSQSVAHSGYFGQKLYMAFLRMSLHCCSASENAVSISDAAELVVFLKSGSVSRRDSQNFVVQLVKEQPRLLVECLCGDHESRELLLSYLMPSVKFGVTESLLSSISLSLAEATDDFRRKVWSHKNSVEWLVEISEEKFVVAFGKSVLRWIAANKSCMDFSIGSLFRLLYCEVTGHGDYSKADAQFEILGLSVNTFDIKTESDISRLMNVIVSSDITVFAKRIGIARYWDSHRVSYADAVNAIQKENILTEVMCLTGSVLKKEIIRQAIVQTFGYEYLEYLLRLYEWIETHDSFVRSHIKERDADVSALFLLWIVNQKNSSEIPSAEYLARLLSEWLFDKDGVNFIHKNIFNNAVEVSDIEYDKNVSNEDILRLKEIVFSDIAEGIKQIAVARYWDSHRSSYSDAVNVLLKADMFPLVMRLTSCLSKKEIIRQTIVQTFGNESVEVVLRLYDWVETHDSFFSSYAKDKSTDVSVQLLLWAVSPRENTEDIIHSLLTYLFCDEDIDLVNDEIAESIEYKRNEIESLSRLVSGIISNEIGKHRDGNYATENVTPDDIFNEGLPCLARKTIADYYVHSSPRELLQCIRESVSKGRASEQWWSGFIDVAQWRILACGISVSVEEVFVRTIEIMQIDVKDECMLWASYIYENKFDDWFCNTTEENVLQFVDTVFKLRIKDEADRDSLMAKITELLGIEQRDIPAEDLPCCIKVTNAGLCLLAPWFGRLFAMLGYLDSEHKKFRNTASKIRAVFLLQYLVYGEERTYGEPDLIFNRLLADLPQFIPVPKRLSLTDEEKQTADGMISGVKANWSKMNGTSDAGFRNSFIMRSGTLEQQDECWLLTVDENAYDILLDTIPWAFRQIRLPWLKKMIQVLWHEKQIF